MSFDAASFDNFRFIKKDCFMLVRFEFVDKVKRRKEKCYIFLFVALFVYICIRKSYPNKQSDADHGNWNGCLLITPKRGNSSNSLDFK